ncbi:jg12052 [Pararge aegeria aegeria]|uniref:Jg12052 protein n=1 Tax=Pararge aegeria aegeria TaxID=348720 RepID=A0A8S4RXI9_9NEOP|nr:jg12052 [Pararge aegeria aegeria]
MAFGGAEDDLGVGGVMELRGIWFWKFGARKKQLLTASNGEICLTKPRPTQGSRALMMMKLQLSHQTDLGQRTLYARFAPTGGSLVKT